ncbi:helicase, partial [Tanacetum coccineum]
MGKTIIELDLSFLPKASKRDMLSFTSLIDKMKLRIGCLLSWIKKTGGGVHEAIVTSLIVMLNRSSAVAKAFRMEQDWCHSHESLNFKLHLLSERGASRKYNTPTVSEVAALITNDFGDDIPSRDIVVDSKDDRPKRILEFTRKTKHGFVSMKEYYTCIIQQRNDQGTTLIRGGRLFQQYLFDAYTAVEEQRLKWTRNNQDTQRVDLYHNLYDVVTRGDANAAGLGKRIVLPTSFTAYGNPNLFITFTSNPKWPEIAKMMGFVLGQRSHDLPEVGTRVFKMKLTELLDDPTKNEIFGKSLVCVIEFQKRDLPHEHILLWLEEEWKCKTPDQIDDIMSTEIPSLTHDPDGYKVVTEYMLHGSYGKCAACIVEGKCSIRFPKAFYAETMINEDGPLQLWEENWEALSDDILDKKRKLF